MYIRKPITTIEQTLEIQEFDGPPVLPKIRPGCAGLNIKAMHETFDAVPLKHRYWIPILKMISRFPQETGYVPTAAAIAREMGISAYTILRELSEFEQRGIVYRITFNGRFVYSPDYLVVRDHEGVFKIHSSPDHPALNGMPNWALRQREQSVKRYRSQVASKSET